MKNNKKNGISLIVLVITIIVIIILAAAVILTLNNNNPITEANKARYESDVANMQAIFTNTVAKVMAQNQSTISLNAGSLNSEKTGGSSTEGRVSYILDNPLNIENENVEIVFNTGTNNETTYYTGKMLPIYGVGETTWYVDSEGVISLKINEQEYGKGDKQDNPAGNESTTVGMLQSWASDRTTDFHNTKYSYNITKIKFSNNMEIPDTKIESWDVSETKDGSVIAWVEDNGNKGYELTIAAKSKIKANPDSSYLFYSFRDVTEIENLQLLDTSNVENMREMFRGMKKLTTIDMSNFNTSKVTNMLGIFWENESLTSIDLSKMDTSKVKDMTEMFRGCKSLISIDFSGLNTENLPSMSGIFRECVSLTSVNLNGIDTSNVTTMAHLFSGCTELRNISLEGINTSNVTIMQGMFYNCQKLTKLDLSSFDTSKVNNMNSMFYNCKELTNLGESHFDTSKVEYMESMFKNCNKLTATIAIKNKNARTTDIFSNAATVSSAKITVNYTSETSSKVDTLIENKTEGSRIVKGIQI